MSTARISIIRLQVAISQSCSPPVTGDVQGIGHLLGLLELPVETWLFEMLDAVVLQQAADLDRALRRKAAIGVDQQRRRRRPAPCG